MNALLSNTCQSISRLMYLLFCLDDTHFYPPRLIERRAHKTNSREGRSDKFSVTDIQKRTEGSE